MRMERVTSIETEIEVEVKEEDNLTHNDTQVGYAESQLCSYGG